MRVGLTEFAVSRTVYRHYVIDWQPGIIFALYIH